MSTPGAVAIEIHDWAQAAPWASPLRTQVFVLEQGVPPEIELDAFDALSRHALAFGADGRAVGTGRLLPDGHIGRMAVHVAWRDRGIGGAVLEALVAEAAGRGLRRVVLNAQVTALGFYRRHGFVEEGEAFVEAGILHRTMWRAIELADGSNG